MTDFSYIISADGHKALPVRSNMELDDFKYYLAQRCKKDLDVAPVYQHGVIELRNPIVHRPASFVKDFATIDILGSEKSNDSNPYFTFVVVGNGLKVAVIQSKNVFYKDVLTQQFHLLHPEGYEKIWRTKGVDFVSPQVHSSLADYVNAGPALIVSPFANHF